MKKELVHDVLRRNAERFPDKEGIIDGSRTISHNELYQKQQKTAGFLRNNFDTGDRIALLIGNSIEFITSFYGVLGAGMVCVPIDPNTHINNIMYMFNDCGIRAAIVSEGQKERIMGRWDDFNSLEKLITDVPREAQRGNSGETDNAIARSDDLAVIMYTTGTTGPKKGAMLTHYNLLAATRNINVFMGIGEWAREVIPIPLAHSFGLGRIRCVFGVAGTVILEKGFLFPNKILEDIWKHRANGFSSVPAGFAILLDRFEAPMRRYARNLRYIEIGSAFMRREHRHRLMEICPKTKIFMHYGLTEASRSAFTEFHSESGKFATVGKPSPNVNIKILDKDGKELPAGSIGEICIKADTVMKGYWGKEKISRIALRGGLLHTGDIGKIDGEGYVYLLGRDNDIINVGGLKVAPGEIEEVILRMKKVHEAAVTGASNGLYHDAIKAFVVCSDKIDPKDIRKHCAAELEHYKIPQIIEFVKKLPKTGSGKIMRHVLRETNGGEHG